MTFRYVRAAALTAALLTLSACAATPGAAPGAAQPAALDPVGTFTFRSEARGEEFQGVIRIQRSESGAWTGTVTTPLTGDLPIRAVDVQGSRLVVTAQGRMGDAVLSMDFEGSGFTGEWRYGPSQGRMTGTRATP